jgi:hypothetical protein
VGAGQGHETNRVAIDAEGNAFCVWQEHETSSRAMVNRLVKNSGFTGPEELSPGAGESSRPDVANDTWGGRWIVVWVQDGDIVARRFVNGSWSGTDVLDDSTAPARTPRIAMGMEIGVLAVWVQEDDTGTDSLYSSEFDWSTGWSAPVLVENDDQSVRDPALAMDGFGNAVAAWVRNQDAQTTTRVWANNYEYGVGWSVAGP